MTVVFTLGAARAVLDIFVLYRKAEAERLRLERIRRQLARDEKEQE